MGRGRQAVRVLGMALALGVFATLGCTSTAPHPEEVLDSYVDNVRHKRVDAVYRVLGDDLQSSMTRKEFALFFADNYAELLAQAERIQESSRAGEMQVVAEIPMGTGSTVALEYDDGQWLLRDDIPAIAGASSPRGILAALSRAVEEEDMEAILRLLSKEKSDTLRAELAILSTGLANVQDEDIVVSEDNATIFLDWGLQIELVYEKGTWRLHRLTQQ